MIYGHVGVSQNVWRLACLLTCLAHKQGQGEPWAWPAEGGQVLFWWMFQYVISREYTYT